jgi:hypothetical protein
MHCLSYPLGPGPIAACTVRVIVNADFEPAHGPGSAAGVVAAVRS